MPVTLESRTHPHDPGEPQHGRPRVGIAPDEEPILTALARGRRVLDIGTGLGYAMRALLRGCPRVVHTVDPDPWVVRLLQGELPTDILPTWPAAFHLGSYDVIFIDADHVAAAVEADVRRALAYVRPGGIILLHDWTADPEVAIGTRRATTLPVYAIATTYGLGMLVTPLEDDRDG